MSAFVTTIFSFTTAFAALLLGAVWFSTNRGSGAARRYLRFVGAFYTLASIWMVPYAAGRVLVAGYRPFSKADVPSGRTAIVVLGAGNFGVDDWDGRPLWMLDPTGGARVQETLRVYDMIPGATVISSGGLPEPDVAVEPSAITMQRLLVASGVAPSRILLESDSRNTHDEAVLVAMMVRALGIRYVVLVTTDFHMRRSDGVFRAVGINAIPAIARDPHAPWPWWARWLPTNHGLHLSAQVVHEFLGLAAYRARGWMG